MKFRMQSDFIFSALNIDDAFEKLRDHFDAILNDGNSSRDFIETGEINITPIKEELSGE